MSCLLLMSFLLQHSSRVRQWPLSPNDIEIRQRLESRSMDGPRKDRWQYYCLAVR
jgi:hypothetical protein